MTTFDAVRKKPGLNWKERAVELDQAGASLYAKHVEMSASLVVHRARLKTAVDALAWARAHPWRALGRRLVGKEVG